MLCIGGFKKGNFRAARSLQTEIEVGDNEENMESRFSEPNLGH